MKHVIRVIICVLAGPGFVLTDAAEEPAGVTAAVRAPTCTASDCHSKVMQHSRIHQPVLENKCDACHEAKKGATPFQAGPRHEFKRAGDNPELCYACHDRLAAEGFVHEPVKMGVCVLCHDPHGSEHALLLRVDTDRKLCAQCHRETYEQGDHVHPPVSDGTCGACHDPHGSGHDKLLRAAAPALCLDCHDTIEDLLDEADVIHDAVTTGRSCLGCHDPHVSDVEPLLAGAPMELCLSCHNEELDSDGGKIRNIAEQLKENPNHHGPTRDGNCMACHNPHGGMVYRMLVEAYPAKADAPYEEGGYALCFGCHDVEMVEEERDEEVTEFRNGDLNLHYVHVNREDKGSSCSVCHEVHGSKNPKHIAESTTVDGRALLIKYAASKTGGSCSSGCHKMLSYDRVQPVKNE